MPCQAGSQLPGGQAGACAHHCPNYRFWKRINLDQPYPPLQMLGREGWPASLLLTMGGEDKYKTEALLRKRGGTLVVRQVTHSVHTARASFYAPKLPNDLPFKGNPILINSMVS